MEYGGEMKEIIFASITLAGCFVGLLIECGALNDGRIRNLSAPYFLAFFLFIIIGIWLLA